MDCKKIREKAYKELVKLVDFLELKEEHKNKILNFEYYNLIYNYSKTKDGRYIGHQLKAYQKLENGKLKLISLKNKAGDEYKEKIYRIVELYRTITFLDELISKWGRQ